MFVYLSKLLPTLATPVGLLLLLFLIGLLFCRSPKAKNRVLILSLLVLMVCGNQWPGALLTHQLEQMYPPYTGTPTADAIVVLGGGTMSKAWPRQIVEVNGAGDRIIYGAKLYADGVADKLLVSGSYISWRDGKTNGNGAAASPASENAELAQMLGVPAEAILVQPKSVNTYEESVDDTALLRELGCKRIILVTSATHMRRAAALFRKQGLEVIPAPTDYSYSDVQWENMKNITLTMAYSSIIPTAGNMNTLQNALKEYIGYWVYQLRGWI